MFLPSGPERLPSLSKALRVAINKGVSWTAERLAGREMLRSVSGGWRLKGLTEFSLRVLRLGLLKWLDNCAMNRPQ